MVGSLSKPAVGSTPPRVDLLRDGLTVHLSKLGWPQIARDGDGERVRIARSDHRHSQGLGTEEFDARRREAVHIVIMAESAVPRGAPRPQSAVVVERKHVPDHARKGL